MKAKFYLFFISVNINLLFAFDTFDVVIDSLSQQISNVLQMTGKINIAVIDFIFNDKVTEFSRFLTDELIKRLSIGNLNVNGRELINKKLKELKISVSDVYSLECGTLKELALVLDVDFIIWGKIRDPAPDMNLELQIEIISAETGKRYKFFLASINKDNKLKKDRIYTTGQVNYSYLSSRSVHLS